MLIINGIDELRRRVGTELGVSSWHEITQERIAAFAAATDDYEELHLSPERAASTPWGVTIAHGLFTLSLGPKFMYEIYEMRGLSLWLNYGFDRVRFVSPVPVESRVRMRAQLTAVDDVEGGVRARILETFEIDGHAKPACVAESVVAYFD
ncbi:MAG: MaoC family dehydratase [Solirubrobacterales bacterium]|nr:MaoC family dehydratase [Solirubrobacterales bacterium]